MIDINKLTLEQAKSLAYDTLVRIEQGQNDLKLLNQVIQQKTSELMHGRPGQPIAASSPPWDKAEPIKKPKKA